jgi:hypothetical protein
MGRPRAELLPLQALSPVNLLVVPALPRQGMIGPFAVDCTQPHLPPWKKEDARPMVAVPLPEEVVLPPVVAAKLLIVAEEL